MRAVIAENGGRGPAVVYLPGVGGMGTMAQLCMQRLRPDFRALALRYEEGGPDTYPALADSVVDAADEAGITRFVLLAESFGGGVAFHAALRAPERVRGLAIVNSFSRYPSRRALCGTRALATLTPPRLFAWVRGRYGARGVLGPRWTQELEDHMRSVAPRFDRAYRIRLRMVATLDLDPLLPQVVQPATLFASADDRIVPSVACAQRMAALLPDARLEIVPDAGHLILPVEALPWPRWIGEIAARGGIAARPAGGPNSPDGPGQAARPREV